MNAPYDEDQVIRRLQQLRAESADRTDSLDEAANWLFERHRGAITAYCRRLVDSESHADELVNDTFLVAWRRLDSFAFQSSFRGWLFGIARFTCLRANRKKTELLAEDGVIDSADPALETWRLIDHAQRADIVNEAVRGLPDLEQRALTMRYAEDLPVRQITRALGLENRSGARGLLVRCRRHFEQRLRAIMEERDLHTSLLLTQG